LKNDGYVPERETVPYLDEGGVIYINTNVFIEYLEKAFISVVKDFRKKEHEAYSNALENSMHHPVLVDIKKSRPFQWRPYHECLLTGLFFR
jgi:hypothetical protein